MSANVSSREFLKQGTNLALAAGLVGSDAAAAGRPRPIREFSRGGMLYSRLGQADLFVSRLSFGSHVNPAYQRSAKHGSTFSEEGQASRDRRIAKAFDYGVNMVNTYENAGQWQLMARLVHGRREKVLVSICRQFRTSSAKTSTMQLGCSGMLISTAFTSATQRVSTTESSRTGT